MYANANDERYNVVLGREMNVRIKESHPYCYEDAKQGDDVYRVELPYGYVSEALCDEIQEWSSKMGVFIAADTGLGKNTFVETCLIPYVVERCGQILLLTNRVALGRQEKKRLAGIFGMEKELEDYTDQGLDKLTQFGCLTVLSYQQLENGIRYGSGKIKEISQTEFDFVVMDEAHYFVTDSGFNALTDVSLSFLCEHFYQSVKIYMTATPQEIFPIVKKRDLLKRMGENGKYYFTAKSWLLYEFAHDFSWLKPFAFESEEDLADLIRRSREKWLIFVNSIKKGNELCELLGEGVVITAESKKRENETNPHFLQVVNEERCDERVVITTAVLENGVNIKDLYVKNIAIFSNDKIQFLQMLGRVRRYPGSQVNVYISNSDTDDISRWKQSCYNAVKAAKFFEADPAGFYDEYVQNATPRVNVKGAFTVMRNGHAHLNVLLKVKKEIYDVPFWESLKARCQNGETYALLSEKFSWIGKEFQEENFAGRRQFEEALKNFNNYLEALEGKEMKEEEKKQFSREFTELYKMAFGKRKEDKTNTQDYGAAVIKKLLQERHLDYVLNTSRQGWTLTRKTGEEGEE